MNFEHEIFEKCVVVRPDIARLDSTVAPDFRQHVIDLSGEHTRTIIIDLINVEFMDSSGLGAIIGCYKAEQVSGDMALCNVHKNVKEVFTLTHMDRIFEIHDDFNSCVSNRAA